MKYIFVIAILEYGKVVLKTEYMCEISRLEQNVLKKGQVCFIYNLINMFMYIHCST